MQLSDHKGTIKQYPSTVAFHYAPLGTCYMERISCCIVSQTLLDYSP